MANLRRWSSSASGNATVTGGVNTINFAEGQTPGSVNNSAREMMAQVRSIYTPSEWGWVENSATASVASQTSFKLAGNQTTDWTAGRRWRLKSGSTTRYGSVVSSSYTAETTITVTVDSGSLSASHSLAAVSVIDSNNASNYARKDAANVFTAGQSITSGGLAISGGGVTDSSTSGITITGSGPFGFATGSGGAVTQLTSKATAVTLNKTNGQITMNNAALASGASVVFGLTNSAIAAGDVVIASHNAFLGGTSGAYVVQVITSASGGANVRVTNISGGSLSEALVINFAVIKAVNS